MSTLEAYLNSEREHFEEWLCEFLRIPSVSAGTAQREALDTAARWLHTRFLQMGFAAEIVATDGNPIVLAEGPRTEGARTVLVYGHYDVQPPDPLDQWISPPFEPERREGNIYARGASDDKGQLLTHVFSAQARLAVEGKLPVNLKFVIEGEEETGSGNLARFLQKQAQRLACDCIVVSDMSQLCRGQPAITYGLRGIAYYELTLTGPSRDLHSGSFGGAVTNPANALAGLLGRMTDERGRIQIPGFYDDVVPIDAQERERFAMLPFREEDFFTQVGVKGAVGETGFTSLERRWARPSFDISGLTAGYQGEGAKTIIPQRASAKFSLRLVPNQDPEKVTASLRAMLSQACPAGVEMELVEIAASPGVLVRLDSPYVEAAARAIEHGFGRPPVFIREGGSIPIVAKLHQTLKADVLLLGWGQPDDNAHAPNEKFALADFHRGIRTSARLWHELSRALP